MDRLLSNLHILWQNFLKSKMFMIFMCLKSIYIVSSDSSFYTMLLWQMTSALTLKVSQDKVHPVKLQLSKDDSERFRNTEPGPWVQQPWNMFLIYMLKETHTNWTLFPREAPIHFYEQIKMMYCYKIRQVFWTAFQMDHWVSNQNLLCTFYHKNFWSKS